MSHQPHQPQQPPQTMAEARAQLQVSHQPHQPPQPPQTMAEARAQLQVSSDLYARMGGVEFVSGFNRVLTFVHSTAIEKGWWDNPRNEGEIIALIHSELSEALKGLRNGNPPDEHLPNYTSVEIELADTIIRIMDFAASKGMRLSGAILSKAIFNAQRPRMHGGKRF